MRTEEECHGTIHAGIDLANPGFRTCHSSSVRDKSLVPYRQRSVHGTVRARVVVGERCGYGDLQ